MKKLLILLFIVALVGCDESNEPLKAEEYNDIAGEWGFSYDNLSAEFEIVKTLDGKYAIESGNTFKINDKTHTSTNNHTITINGLKIGNIYLSTNDAEITLYEILYKSDFSEMTSGGGEYRENCPTPCSYNQITTALKITRK